MARQGLLRALRACVALAGIAVLLVPAVAEARYAHRTLRPGTHGHDVKRFQKYLRKAGFSTRATGYYGTQTTHAERSFETQTGRHVDGRASRRDQRLVRRAARHGGIDAAGTGGQGYMAAPGNPTDKARMAPDGRTAIAPDSAPQSVKDAIAAANRITSKPYRYGGGHGQWEDSGYDCSGSVSYALHGGNLLDRPLDSTSFESWGRRGRGQWITVYANSGHAYAVIAGLRFDTSGDTNGETGPRWHTDMRSGSGYVVRHPAGL